MLISKDDSLVSLPCPIWSVLQSGNGVDCEDLILISWIFEGGGGGGGHRWCRVVKLQLLQCLVFRVFRL